MNFEGISALPLLGKLKIAYRYEARPAVEELVRCPSLTILEISSLCTLPRDWIDRVVSPLVTKGKLRELLFDANETATTNDVLTWCDPAQGSLLRRIDVKFNILSPKALYTMLINDTLSDITMKIQK